MLRLQKFKFFFLSRNSSTSLAEKKKKLLSSSSEISSSSSSSFIRSNASPHKFESFWHLRSSRVHPLEVRKFLSQKLESPQKLESYFFKSSKASPSKLEGFLCRNSKVLPSKAGKLLPKKLEVFSLVRSKASHLTGSEASHSEARMLLVPQKFGSVVLSKSKASPLVVSKLLL